MPICASGSNNWYNGMWYVIDKGNKTASVTFKHKQLWIVFLKKFNYLETS